MSTTQLQLRRGNTAQNQVFTGGSGEITFDTDKNTLIAHDGVTMGGFQMAKSTDILNTLGSYSFSSTSQQTIDSFSTSLYRTGIYTVQITSGPSFQTIGFNVLHDGTVITKLTYNDLNNSGSLGTFDANIISGTLNILFTPVHAVTTINFIRELIPV